MVKFQWLCHVYEKGSSAVEGKHFDLDILMGGDMKFLQLGLGGSLCNYSCPWCRVHKKIIIIFFAVYNAKNILIF
jgi:hypothetical protein